MRGRTATARYLISPLNTGKGNTLAKSADIAFKYSLSRIDCSKHVDWSLISNNVQSADKFVILDLEPATWYDFRITAHNSAGSTVVEHKLATLTVIGGNNYFSD